MVLDARLDRGACRVRCRSEPRAGGQAAATSSVVRLGGERSPGTSSTTAAAAPSSSAADTEPPWLGGRRRCALELVAERVQPRIASRHRASVLCVSRCRRTCRPRWTRTRAAAGVVPRRRRPRRIRARRRRVGGSHPPGRRGARRAPRRAPPATSRPARRLGVDGETQALAGSPLEPAAPDGADEDVPCDGEEPRPCGASGPVAESQPREPRLRERLGRQVVRGLRLADAAEVVAVDALGVTLVERPEGGGVASRGDEQMGVGRQRHTDAISRRGTRLLHAG